MKEVTKQAEETQISHKNTETDDRNTLFCHRNAASPLCGRLAYVM